MSSLSHIAQGNASIRRSTSSKSLNTDGDILM